MKQFVLKLHRFRNLIGSSAKNCLIFDHQISKTCLLEDLFYKIQAHY